MERKKFYVVLDIITNILIVPVLLIALLCSILMYSAKKQNAVPSLFGYSAVKILTESMETEENPQFKAGNTVLVKKVNPETIKAGRTDGSVIAFYEYVYPGDASLDLQNANGGTIVGGNTDLTLDEYVGGGTNEAAQKGSRVLFHRVVDIKVASTANGEVHYFFSTQGDANLTPDIFTDDSDGEHTAYIRDDFVVGVYAPSSGFVTGLFSFCASPMGIISLVIIPAGIVLIMVTASIIDQINMIVAQKKMDRRKLIEAEKMLQGETSQIEAETPQAGEGELPDKEPEEPKQEPAPKAEKPVKAPKKSVVAKAPVKPEASVKAEAPAKAEPKAPAKPVKAEAPAKPETPKAPAKATKTPAKAPEAPKASAKAEVPKAPAKVAPAKAPSKAPTAPKAAPAKAPAKTPAAPKTAPVKAPAKAAPKAPAKPQKPE